MPFIKTNIADLLVYEPRVFEDDRGYFFEAYNQQHFAEVGVTYRFVQDNQSKSSYGVIRGLHYQLNPHAQTKLVRVLEGAILDVAVDIRKGSSTYGHHFAIELTADNKKTTAGASGIRPWLFRIESNSDCSLQMRPALPQGK